MINPTGLLSTFGIMCSLLGSAGIARAAGQAASTPAPLKEVAPGRYCSRVGIVVGTDPLNRSFLLKRDNDCNIETIAFSTSTRFITASAAGPAGQWEAVEPHSINIGDRLCVQFANNGDKEASVVLVVSRADMRRQQVKVLSALHRDSAFGTITKLDATTRTIGLNRISMDGSAHPMSVDAKDPVLFRRYGEDATALSDAEAGSWEELGVGDQIYVRGERSADGSSIRAGLILSGGLRTFVGGIRSMDALTERIEVQDVDSQKLLAVHVSPGALFRISPFRPNRAAGAGAAAGDSKWTLHSLNFGDLHDGDVVAVLGRVSDCAPQAQALAVFEVYGSFDLVPRQPAEQVLWLLDPLNLDVK